MARQRGVATLVVSVGVALLMAVAAVGMMRSGLLEQKIAANDLRAREAQEIAQAGLESIMASSYVPTQACVEDSNKIPDLSDSQLGAFSGSPSAPVGEINQTSKEGYALPSVKGCSSGGYYFARSQVELSSGSSKIKYFAEAWFRREKSAGLKLDSLPPFLVNGSFCVDATGKDSCKGGSASIAIPSDSPSGLLWVLAKKSANTSVFQSGSTVPPLNSDDALIPDGGSAWDYVFGVLLSDAKQMALSSPGSPFYYFPDGKNINPSIDIISSENNPVVLILDSNDSEKCPKINGNISIYGVVYVSNACKENGWGSATIVGSVVYDGNVDKLNANTKFIGFSKSGFDAMKRSPSVFIIPGTWRDFGESGGV